jgi:hypothetical protein
VGGGDEPTDNPLQVDPHRRFVHVGLQRLGTEDDVALCRLGDPVAVQRVEPEGAAQSVGKRVCRRRAATSLRGIARYAMVGSTGRYSKNSAKRSYLIANPINLSQHQN